MTKHLLAAALAAASVSAVKLQAQSSTITQWAFPSAVAAPDNSPAPTTGSGTAITLGMTNSYNGGNTASDDVLSTPGTAFPSFSENTWRIRGASHNGWALAAPQYTQGVEFDVSTVGYTNIGLSFDWYCTTQGIRDLQVQYSQDVTNPSDWTNFGAPLVATPNDYYGGTNSSPDVSLDLSTLSALIGNDANFGVRLVSAYDPTYTGTGAPTYTSATLSSGNPVQYNNTSGNWRFGNITISGTAVPEPGSAALLVPALGFIAAGLLTPPLVRRQISAFTTTASAAYAAGGRLAYGISGLAEGKPV